MSLDLPFWIPIAFFWVAFVYSMAGFAGGSSYIALLLLAGLSHQEVAPIALICNLVVSMSTFGHFYRGGHFKLRTVLPFIVFSVPMAYWGAKLSISKELFYGLLGFSLLMAAVRMFLSSRRFEESRPVSQRDLWTLGSPVGALTGFLSGIVGIGGGIFLSPFLLLKRWANAKQAAAAASFFILVNSFFGLLGQMQKNTVVWDETVLYLVLVVFVGGQLGSSLGSYRLPRFIVQRVSACLICYVSTLLLMKGF